MNKSDIEEAIFQANKNCSKAGESLTGLQRMYLIMAFEESNNLLKPDVIGSVCNKYATGIDEVGTCVNCGGGVYDHI